jgi:hypothetical protein
MPTDPGPLATKARVTSGPLTYLPAAARSATSATESGTRVYSQGATHRTSPASKAAFHSAAVRMQSGYRSKG